MDRPALEQSLIANRAPSQTSPPRSTGWYRSEVRRQDHLIAIEQANRRVVGPAHLGRALGNRIEHRLKIRRRTGNTPKISLVAVCCSNDSLSSWKSRTFSMAITA